MWRLELYTGELDVLTTFGALGVMDKTIKLAPAQ